MKPIGIFGTVRLYNTETTQIEDFVPRSPGRVDMYVCGPTVYAPPHLGHARTVITFDIVRKWFRLDGYDVNFVSNYTDIEDKIIKRANEAGTDAAEIARRYEKVWDDSMAALRVERPDSTPHATAYVPQIIEMIEALVEADHAYEVDGDVYFAVRSFESYGRLSHQKIDDLEAGARVEIGEHKRDPIDFALWKVAKPGEPAWESPWGHGRPGWHIECSVMSVAELGMGFDIHGGGSDLVFPHHENEIAQAEGALDRSPFVRYWLHSGMVNLNHEKMSKSTGNFLLLDDVLSVHSAEAIRLLVAQTHYRSPLDFADELIEEAERAVDRLAQFRDRSSRELGVDATDVFESSAVASAEPDATMFGAFGQAMNDDLHTPRAVAAVFDMVKRANSALDAGDASALAGELAALAAADSVLGIVPPKTSGESGALTAAVLDLTLELRERARAEKDFKTADLIRSRLTELGIIVEDTPEGSHWRLDRRT